MSYYGSIPEEELKNRVREDWFPEYDAKKILGKIDFCVMPKEDPSQPALPGYEPEHLLWAEAKKGKTDLVDAIAQLVITIGKSRINESFLPPPYLAGFDAEGILFVPYIDTMEIFRQTDFNWNVAPSDHATREFRQVRRLVENATAGKSFSYSWKDDATELRKFILGNIRSDRSEPSRCNVTRSNFVAVYLKWLKSVRPTIVFDFEAAKKAEKDKILDADFFLADLLSAKNLTISEKLTVILHRENYELSAGNVIPGMSLHFTADIPFSDNQKAHAEFWNRYVRPPAKVYCEYILSRRDLLVPQSVREEKGSYFTPQCWVERSQDALAAVLGDDWQDEYYIWDCCAGTGNMEVGLTNRDNVWCSTLDQPDVDIMKSQIQQSGANLWESHVFQFDFLDGDFKDLPKELKEIIDDPEKRKRLVVYINPPYAEAGNKRVIPDATGEEKNKSGVANKTATFKRCNPEIKNASLDLFVQFLWRIHRDIPGCKIGNFSKLKTLVAPNFRKFREVFRARLESLFVVPASTFDNVKGSFPIGFFVWDTDKDEPFQEILAEAYGRNGEFLQKKCFKTPGRYIIEWLREYYDSKGASIAFLCMTGCDIQHNRNVYVTLKPTPNDIKTKHYTVITKKNLLPACIYHTVRDVIEDTWLNDRDQYLYPNDGWKDDRLFQTDCLAYAVFSWSNYIQSRDGVNHWIPFREESVGITKAPYRSRFLLDYMSGKWSPDGKGQRTLGLVKEEPELYRTGEPLVFSAEAQAVFEAALPLWKYYHIQPNADPDASFYDIREFFQGRNERGAMNPDSNDAEYSRLLESLRGKLGLLAGRIVPKVYQYGFLLK